MNENQLKNILLSLENSQVDFSIDFVAKRPKANANSITMGDYDEKTHKIRIFSNRHDEYKTLLETVIHEYTHHLMWEYFYVGKIKKRVVHGEEFWLKYRELIQKAKIKGYFIEKTSETDSRISEIVDAWFIREPLMMLTMLAHEVTTNIDIQNFRCGQGRIEYNPNYTKFLTKAQVEERLKTEVIRILLYHPYRQHTNKSIAYQASNITLNEYYNFRELTPRAKDFWNTPDFFKQNFEFYVRELTILPPPQNEVKDPYDDSAETNCMPPSVEPSTSVVDNDTNEENMATHFYTASADGEELGEKLAELWDEDDFMQQRIHELIENAASDTTQWGSIPAYLKQTLIANLKPKTDYQKILRSFRASVVSSDKFLTRFKPSRRYAWQYMGKKNDFTTNLLVAVDVSGSISNKDLSTFYSVINRFFKYGIKQINVIQFDTEIKGEPKTLLKAKKEINILGRGGTYFQPAIDYFSSKLKIYDGLIILTDGYAEPPTTSARINRKILWLCNNKKNFERNKEWMTNHGKCCWIE